MGKREDIAYLVACIESSHDTIAIEQIFIEIAELLSKGTKYSEDVKRALERYNNLKSR